MRIFLEVPGQHAHAAAGHQIICGNESGGVVPEQIPAKVTGLAAGKSGHDGIHVSGDDHLLAVSALRAPEHAVRLVGLHHDHLRRVVRIQGSEISDGGSCHRPYACLHEDMGRTLCVLLGGLIRHDGVSLHDPQRDILISFPGRILDDHAVLILVCQCGGLAHALIVVQVLDGDFGAQGLDVVEPGLAGALRHQDDAALSQLSGGPCHAAAVIAVRGRDEGGASELLPEFIGLEHGIRQVPDIPVHFLRQIFSDGVGPAQDLEGVESVSPGLVLHAHAADAQELRHLLQILERRLLILRKGAVEIPGHRHLRLRHQVEIRVVRLRKMVVYILQIDRFHTRLLASM